MMQNLYNWHFTMNQELQNQLFKDFEAEEYYSRHFKQQIRPDGRKLQETRQLNLTLNSFSDCSGSCVLRRGGSMIICQIKAEPKEIPINPLKNSFSIPLLSIQTTLSEHRHITHLDRIRKQSYISYEVEQFLKKHEQPQKLCIKENGKTYGYVLNVDIRILDQDGSLLPYCLLCSQLALFTTKLSQLNVQNGNLTTIPNSQTFLDLQGFYFPISYSEVYGQILIDPSYCEEKDSAYSLQIMWEINNKDAIKPASIRKFGKQGIQQSIIEKIVELSKIQADKIKLNVKEIRERLNKNNGEVNIQIS